MNRIKLQDIGVVIMIFIMMTTLLSCTKTNDTIIKEIAKLNMEQSFNELKNEMGILVESVAMEQAFFKNDLYDNDYDVFIAKLPKTFEQSSNDFAKVHNQILIELEALTAKYGKDSDELLTSIDLYQVQLSELFDNLLQYHYMILESDFLVSLFNETVTNMLTYVGDGNTTSVEYNEGLQLLMADYSDLLSIDKISIFNNKKFQDEKTIIELLSSVANAKSDIKNLHTLTKVDEKVNQFVYDMFDYVEQSISSIYDYMKQTKPSSYIVNESMTIDEDAKAYYEAVILGIDNPFSSMK